MILWGIEAGQVVTTDQNRDASCHAGLSRDQPGFFERDEHQVDGGRRDAKEALYIGLRWRTTIDQRVGVDERQILTLPWGEL